MKKTLGLVTFITTNATLLMVAANSAVYADLCPSDSELGATGLKDLCTTAPGINSVVSTIINVVLFIAFVAALVYLIIGGIRWIMSGGDKEGTAKAKAGVTSALIGLAIVLAAYILINAVLGFFGVGGIGGIKAPTIKFSGEGAPKK